VTDSALETYLATVDDRHRALVHALDEAVRAAEGELESRYGYGMLLYSRPGQPRSRWVCGISTSSKGAQLRFLLGTSMPDPRGILRGGTATLMSIDYASLEDLDASVATAYVRDALAVEDAGGPPAG
jgi:hypothetical protein